MSRTVSVGVLIRRARERRGLTQLELAEKIGSTQPYIARLEAGHGAPRVDTIQRIGDALGYTLAVIFSAPTPTEEPHTL